MHLETHFHTVLVPPEGTQGIAIGPTGHWHEGETRCEKCEPYLAAHGWHYVQRRVDTPVADEGESLADNTPKESEVVRGPLTAGVVEALQRERTAETLATEQAAAAVQPLKPATPAPTSAVLPPTTDPEEVARRIAAALNPTQADG